MDSAQLHTPFQDISHSVSSLGKRVSVPGGGDSGLLSRERDHGVGPSPAAPSCVPPTLLAELRVAIRLLDCNRCRARTKERSSAGQDIPPLVMNRGLVFEFCTSSETV